MHVKRDWQLQHAKANLSEVVNRAVNEGPQRITRYGRGAAVVLSERDYGRLISRTRGSLTEFLGRSPLRAVPMDVRNLADTSRESDL